MSDPPSKLEVGRKLCCHEPNDQTISYDSAAHHLERPSWPVHALFGSGNPRELASATMADNNRYDIRCALGSAGSAVGIQSTPCSGLGRKRPVTMAAV